MDCYDKYSMKVVKSFFLFLTIAVSVLAIGAFVVTRSLSTQMGKERLLQAINHRIPGTLSVDELSLSWISPSYAKNLSLKDASGKVLLRAEEAELMTPLWRLIFPSPTAEGGLKNFSLTLVADLKGLSTLEQALSFEAANQPLGETLSPLYLEKGQLFYQRGKAVRAEASTRQNDIIGSFNLNGTLNNGVDLEFQAQNLPTLLIDQIGRLQANTPPRFFETLLGKTFSTSLKLKGDLFEQSFKAPELNFVMKGKKTNERVLFDSPSGLVYQITPDKLKALEKTFDLALLPALDAPFELKLNADNLKINLDDNAPLGTLSLNVQNVNFQSAFIQTGSLEVNFDVKDALSFKAQLIGSQRGAPLNFSGSGSLRNGQIDALVNFQGKDIFLQNGKVTTTDIRRKSQLSGTLQADLVAYNGHKGKLLPSDWNYRNDQLNLNFKLGSKAGTLYGKANLKPKTESLTFEMNQKYKGGTLSLYGHLEEVFKPYRTIHINTELKNFPSEALAEYLPHESQMTNLLYALFGYSVTGNMKAEIIKMKGPFSLNLKGERIDLSTEGKIENEVAYLSKPLTASIIVSEEVSTYFLDEILPLLNSAVRGDKPIQLTINPEGFYLPLSDLSMASLSLPSASLDMGKLYFSRDGKLAEVLSLLRLPPEKVFSVWFTPLYFSIEKGKLTLNRVDMLVADTAPIATWGTIDFPADKVRMEVGLTGRALTKAFGPLPLPKSYMLAIPLRGTTNNAKLDKTKIAAKLSSLAAMATGPQGILVGALIQIASGSLTDTVPEPTTKPLPWSTEAETPNGEEPPDEPDESFLEQGAGAILNTFLG